MIKETIIRRIIRMSYVKGLINVNLDTYGITAEDLQNLLGYEELSAKELLSGKITFTGDEIKKVAEFINISVAELIGDNAIV